MDVVVLEKDGSNPSYLPIEYVEGFTSKIWTERFRSPYGEIELHTPLIDDTLAKIPEGALLSILQSSEVMLIHTRDIVQEETGTELVIKGKSLAGFTEHRHFDGAYNKKFKMTYNYILTYAQAVEVLLWNAFVNGSENDVLRDSPATKSVLDKIPNVVISDHVPNPGGAKNRWLTPGSVQVPVEQFLVAGQLGIRTLRPYLFNINIVTVDTTGGNRGSITNTDYASHPSLAFDVYKGADRTTGQTARDPVIFSELGGELELPDYLRATDKYKTFARVVSEDGSRNVARKASDKDFSGLNRRVIYVDGGSKETGQSQSEFVADLVDLGQTTLGNNDRTNLITTDVAAKSGFVYKQHYYLGDKVTLRGKYGIEQDMYVTEFVLTEDANGNAIGTPGLTLPEELDDSGTAE